jgi:hypothetical protein
MTPNDKNLPAPFETGVTLLEADPEAVIGMAMERMAASWPAIFEATVIRRPDMTGSMGEGFEWLLPLVEGVPWPTRPTTRSRAVEPLNAFMR